MLAACCNAGNTDVTRVHSCAVCVCVCVCVQSIYEDVARDTNRGHTVEAVKECFVLAKDAGFKVSAVRKHTHTHTHTHTMQGARKYRRLVT